MSSLACLAPSRTAGPPLCRALGQQLGRRQLCAAAGPSQRRKVVVVGTGWAGTRVARDLNMDLYDLTVISLRNHMVFTPLLPQTTTGTLEFRSICEPIFNVQPALTRSLNAFVPAMVYGIDTAKKEVQCVTVNSAHPENSQRWFSVPYDALVLAHGAEPLTFGVPGVEEHAYFLREVSEARAIRRHLLRNMGLAAVPGLSEEERRQLLHVVVVGGGPTGVEFAGDLCDFINEDVKRVRPLLRHDVKVTLVEANEVLGSFDRHLRDYAARTLTREGVHLKRATVKEVRASEVVLSSGEVFGYGLMVWSTGVGPSMLTKRLGLATTKEGRIAVDARLHAYHAEQLADGVYALGDCAAYHASVGQPSLPCLAAVANRQAKYLARMLNAVAEGQAESDQPVFSYRHPGSMASLGSQKALVDLRGGLDLTGFRAWLTWRSAYLTMLGSMRSRLYVAVQWAATMLFGRDVTYIADAEEVSKGRQYLKQLLADRDLTQHPNKKST